MVSFVIVCLGSQRFLMQSTVFTITTDIQQRYGGNKAPFTLLLIQMIRLHQGLLKGLQDIVQKRSKLRPLIKISNRYLNSNTLASHRIN
ncbi:hypothetical protein A1332_11635 [Methylomonas methanica]|uniref:Uncharacterized protein n=1 Tax=Methylomonas methanica TaxID=421 RepID=A0A177MLJ3_METMH|nr:hypothetical protein A1332_11635 [Methylomonas methanica]